MALSIPETVPVNGEAKGAKSKADCVAGTLLALLNRCNIKSNHRFINPETVPVKLANSKEL
jgi:hypothetical protein